VRSRPVHASPSTNGPRFILDELGWAWAAHLQRHAGGLWLVIWEPGGQHFTAFYLGDTAEGGAYRKASTPQGLWEHMLAFDPQRPNPHLGNDDARDTSVRQQSIDGASATTQLIRPSHALPLPQETS
jgi:hypothetical protein